MFVVRYLILAGALAIGTVVWSVVEGLPAWQIAGRVGLALFGLQAGILGMVALLAWRARGDRGSARRPAPADRPPRREAQAPRHDSPVT